MSKKADLVWFEGFLDALAEYPLPLKRQQASELINEWEKNFDSISPKQQVLKEMFDVIQNINKIAR